MPTRADDDDWPDFPAILGQGAVHDLRDADEAQRSRLWGLKSTSKAACAAYDKQSPAPTRQAGFWRRKA